MLVCIAAFYTSASAKETLVKDVAEFDAAVKAAQPGDEIVMADGEWRDADLVFRGKGTGTAPITLRAQTPGKVLLSGLSRLRIGGDFLTARDLLWRDSAAKDDIVAFRYDSKNLARKCTLEECVILGDLPDKERKFVSLYGDSNIVRRCRFEGKQSGGTLLVVWLSDGAPGNNHDISENFFGARERLGKNGGEIIRVGDSKTSLQDSWTAVRKNYFYGCNGEAEIISNKSCGNNYHRNTFVGCGGALTLRHGNRCSVSDNLFFGDAKKGTGGVRIIGEGHMVADNLFYRLLGNGGRAALSIMNGLPDSPPHGYFQVKRAWVVGNVFLDCEESILLGSFDKDQMNQNLPPTDCAFDNNTVVTHERTIATVRTPPVQLTSANNQYFGGPLGLDDATGWQETKSLSHSIPDNMHLSVGGEFAHPSSVGPEWMRPGDEFLPEVLKPADKADTKK